MTPNTIPVAKSALRNKLHDLAESAFHRHLISGHGDGEYPDKYQIVYQGKPIHLTLEEAHDFLCELITQDRSIEHSR